MTFYKSKPGFHMSKPGVKVDSRWRGWRSTGVVILMLWASSLGRVPAVLAEKHLLQPDVRMVPVMALWNNLHPTLAIRFGLGQDFHGLKREEGFTNKGGEDCQHKHFCFAFVFTWNSEVSRQQVAACRFGERALWKIHTKTSFVTWMEELLLFQSSYC